MWREGGGGEEAREQARKLDFKILQYSVYCTEQYSTDSPTVQYEVKTVQYENFVSTVQYFKDSMAVFVLAVSAVGVIIILWV